MVRMNLYKKIGWALGNNLANRSKKKLRYAGININPYAWNGFILSFGLLFGILFFIISYIFVNIVYSIIIGLVIGGVTILLMSISIDILIDKRKRFVESILPDVLSILSINLRGGLTLEEALLAAGKPEFGFFSSDISEMAREIHSGKTLESAIKELKLKINSLVLHRILNLINEGVKSGGEIAIILEKSADSLRRTKLLKEEVKASVTGYFWFIILASSVAAPLLFSSTFFLEKMLLTFIPAVKVPYRFIPKAIPLNIVSNFFLLNISIIGFFGGLLAGVIIKGKEKYGVKYIPIILILSFSIFFGVIFILNHFFGKF